MRYASKLQPIQAAGKKDGIVHTIYMAALVHVIVSRWVYIYCLRPRFIKVIYKSYAVLFVDTVDAAVIPAVVDIDVLVLFVVSMNSVRVGLFSFCFLNFDRSSDISNDETEMK